MSCALTYFILGNVNFFVLQPVSSTLPISPDSNTGTFQGPLQLSFFYNETNTSSQGVHSVSSRKTTWNMARRACQDQGGHLAIVNSIVEAEAIGHLLNKSHVAHGWIGVHDLYEEDEFVTIHGDPLAQTGFDVWHDGEPNNWRDNENCILLSSHGKLIDETCAHRYNFICEFLNVPLFMLQTSTDAEPGANP